MGLDQPYMGMQSYYLDLRNYIWIKIDKTDDLIFEDEEFFVYSLNFGEWGGKTWFKEKSTGHEYVLDATTPLVNKIDSIYYLTNSSKVLRIKNPRLLNRCSYDLTYENIESTEKYYSWHGKPIGFDIVYKDTTNNHFNFNYQPHIVSSFVLNNELLHIYETYTAVYIARHKGYSIEFVQKIAANLDFFNWHYSYRCSNCNGKNELLKFSTKNEQIFGLLEIIDQEIHVTYFKNKALLEPNIIGPEKAEKILIQRLNTILTNLNNLKLSEIDSNEYSWGSFDITPNHDVGVGDEWNPQKHTIDTCRSYLIKEDSIFSNSIMYFGTKERGIVRIVSIDWEYERDLLNFDLEDYAKKIFDKKVEFLISYISKNTGKKTINHDTKDSINRTWETSSGIKLELLFNRKYYELRLVIFSK